VFGIKYSFFPALFSFALLFCALFLHRKKRKESGIAVSFSELYPLPFQKQSLKGKLASVLSWFPQAAFILLLLAATNPHQEEHFSYFSEEPQEGRFLFLLIDQSGSMNTDVVVRGSFGREEKIRKMDLARKVSAQFVSGSRDGFSGREGDLIGLIRFAKLAQIVLPPTFDNKEVARQVLRIDVRKDDSSIGTAIGYAVYKALNMIEMTKKSLKKSRETPFTLLDTAIVIVTDGFEETPSEEVQSPLHSINIQEAALYAKELGVKLYMVNIDPAFSTSEYAEKRADYESLLKITGGNFFIVSSSLGLQEVLRQIEKLQPSVSKQKALSISSIHYLGFPLIALALCLLTLYVLFFSFYGRRA